MKVTSGVELAVLLVMVHRLGASFACVVHVRLMVEEHMQHLIWLFASVLELGMSACRLVWPICYEGEFYDTRIHGEGTSRCWPD